MFPISRVATTQATKGVACGRQVIKTIVPTSSNFTTERGTETKKLPRFEGERNALGEMHGKGKYFFENAARYEGDFKFNDMEGWGKLIVPTLQGDGYEDKIRYEGGFKRNKFHGTGTFYFAGGGVYIGGYSYGKMEGRGVFKMINGDQYEGGFRNSKKEGYGIYIFKESGDMYEGEWKKDGKGVYKFAEGIYEGNFAKGQFEGYGKLMYLDGSIYEGEFVNGLRHGKGVFKDKEGKIVSDGVWKDGAEAMEQIKF